MSIKKRGKADKAPINENAAESLDTVRDLLFGATARNFSDSIAALEKNFESQIERTRQSSDEALEALRAQHEKQLRTAQEQNAAELDDRDKTTTKLETKVDGLFNGMGSDISVISSRLAAAEAELRSLVQSSLEDVRNEMQHGLNRLEQRLDTEIRNRSAESVGRSEFIDVMQTAIERIGGDSGGKSTTGPVRAKAS